MKKEKTPLYIKDFDYPLPPHQIASIPLAERDQSRLLIYRDGCIEEAIFKNLPEHLPHNSVLVVNNTRVIEARVLFHKPTGGVIELFCLEPLYSNAKIAETLTSTNTVLWKCFIGGASKWKPGQILEKVISIENNPLELSARYVGKEQDAFAIEFSWTPGHYRFDEILHAAGAIPLPPYIKRKAEEADAERYQTVFAKHQGSVAAPTAALHFTSEVFERLKQKHIKISQLTLHVGAGTFKPVKTETVNEHQMHAEQFHVSQLTLQQLAQAPQLVAVGTTSLRTLESLYWLGVKLSQQQTSEQILVLGQWEAYELDNGNLSYQEAIANISKYLQQNKLEEVYCETSLLITPGYQFQSAAALITNFHQPQSTLLLLVSAFIGEDWKKVYEYALNHNFRFLSYGDSSLLWRKS